ncbi:MAG: TrmH family RNA methyltransferase [Candidatus Fimadaptatus sp.]
MPEITSTQNPRVKALRALREPKARRREGIMLIEGEKMLAEARASGLNVRDVLYDETRVSAEFAGRGALSAAPHVLESLCETVTPQGIVAAVEPPAQPELEEVVARARARGRALLVAALDGVQDPGNVGTIWRTCDAAAFDALLIGMSCPDPFSPKVLRASMGAAFRVPVLRVDMAGALSGLVGQGCAVVSSQLDGEPFFGGLPGGDVALVIGNEARGVSDEVRALATHRLRLPMPGGAESLNAAVAAGIMIYACIDGRR